ncbi:class E sortase [Streptomyces sp. NPDC048172]|uniref:class E sortase n=1 Tax=Streptomyces sp. NPDC048172 TaxID=3365505 RepID=UPI00371254E7
MTAVRPENEGAYGDPYGEPYGGDPYGADPYRVPDPAGQYDPHGDPYSDQYRAVVDGLHDPLTDPLPGQQPQQPQQYAQPQPQQYQEPQQPYEQQYGQQYDQYPQPQQYEQPYQQPYQQPYEPYEAYEAPPEPDRRTMGLRQPRAEELARRRQQQYQQAPVPPPRVDTPRAERPSGPTRLERLRAERAKKPGPGIIASRFIGEVFITFGVLMLLFVAYQLWWTNIRAGQQAGGAASDLQEQWGDGKAKAAKKGVDPARKAGAFKPGEGFAIIHIPKIGIKAPIAEGVSKSAVLDKGMVGHYGEKPLKTAMPWDKKGNFSLAAHRNTHGEPFRYINKLEAGDQVVVETESTYYTYKVTRQLPSTSPSNTSVIDPVPEQSGFRKPGRYVTLTTCTPEFTSKYRLIVWGKMMDERPRDKGKPDALVD